MVTLERYRRLVVNSWDVEPSWDKVLLPLSDEDSRYYRRGMEHSVLLSINHPLVNSGDAYWINDTTLCVGYTLKSNNAIFRPIFSHSRQDLINEFQENIQNGVLKREEKRAYIEFVRIKKLPIVIVDLIFGNKLRNGKKIVGLAY